MCLSCFRSISIQGIFNMASDKKNIKSEESENVKETCCGCIDIHVSLFLSITILKWFYPFVFRPELWSLPFWVSSVYCRMLITPPATLF